ncbi:sulfotransferase [Thiohalocapsa marina]|uniref:Sulfotransferase n=1 Tax=Thiohalocapsa marina TaxID=424902 RepID=A0A5M8FJE2_9GAMM|nr:sulfotransferase [Thiohalocapsa marina]KAA6184829.1 sulfotransferase [Thiohalocapsa marina]
MNKYLNPSNYARRSLSLANRNILSYLESILAPNIEVPLRHPPIFFLGAPRSGSTLAVQVVTDALDVGYISNRHCQWFGAPALAERLLHPTRNRPASNYQSRQGVTDGWHAPAECGEWWYRFFRRKPPYMRLDEVDEAKMLAFRRSVAALTNAFDRPIVFKNLYASLRIQAIAHYLPESLFIVTHRNEVENGHSLLEARYKRFQSYQPWLSVEPPAVEQLKSLEPHMQVIEQIRHTHKTIDADFALAGVSASRRFDLVYEDFCAEPLVTIASLQDFMMLNGSEVKKRDVIIPTSFARRDVVRIDSSVYESLTNYSASTPAGE